MDEASRRREGTIIRLMPGLTCEGGETISQQILYASPMEMVTKMTLEIPRICRKFFMTMAVWLGRLHMPLRSDCSIIAQ